MIADTFARLLALLKEGTLPVMVPLILVCAGICCIAVERCFYYYSGRQMLAAIWPPARRKLRVQRTGLHQAFEHYVSFPSSNSFSALIDRCREHVTPYTRFLLRTLAGAKDLNNPRLRDLHLAETQLHQELEIERNLGLLSSLSKVAPLLGLLGTVTGMIQTFSVMMSASTSDPRALSSGISIALIATEVGLVVGLPGVVTMSTLSRRAHTLQEEIRLSTMRLRQTAAGKLSGGSLEGGAV